MTYTEFFISFWFSLSKLSVSENIFFIFFRLSSLLEIQFFVVASYDPLIFCVINCNISFLFLILFISFLFLLSLFSLVSLAKGLSILFIFSKDKLSLVNIFFFCSLFYLFWHRFYSENGHNLNASSAAYWGSNHGQKYWSC